MYKYATGWLKWNRQEALNAPIAHILVAMDGLKDCFSATIAGFEVVKEVVHDEKVNQKRIKDLFRSNSAKLQSRGVK